MSDDVGLLEDHQTASDVNLRDGDTLQGVTTSMTDPKRLKCIAEYRGMRLPAHFCRSGNFVIIHGRNLEDKADFSLYHLPSWKFGDGCLLEVIGERQHVNMQFNGPELGEVGISTKATGEWVKANIKLVVFERIFAFAASQGRDYTGIIKWIHPDRSSPL